MLKVDHLSGFGSGGTVVPPTISFQGRTEDATNLTTYTFTGVAIGAANLTRRVVVIVHWFSTTTSAVTLSSATIAGIAATIHVQASPAGSTVSPGIAIISALVPTGTTATIAFTLSTAAARGSIGVFSAIDEGASSPFATASDGSLSSNALDVSLNAPSTGWVLAGSTIAGSASQNATFVGATEDYDTFSSESTSRYYAGGHSNGVLGATPRTVTITNSGAATDGVAASMSWI